MEQVARNEAIDKRALACCLDLLGIASALQQSLETWLNEQGLSRSKFGIIAALADQDGLSPSQLARHLGVRRPTLTGLLDKLEAQGHISRAPAAGDRRRWCVHLSPTGRSLADRAVGAQLHRMANAIAPLSLGERSALRKILSHLVGESAPSNDYTAGAQTADHG